jgi:hypothetical protein
LGRIIGKNEALSEEAESGKKRGAKWVVCIPLQPFSGSASQNVGVDTSSLPDFFAEILCCVVFELKPEA